MKSVKTPNVINQDAKFCFYTQILKFKIQNSFAFDNFSRC